MKPFETTLYPFPHWFDGEMFTGSALSWPTTCTQCKHHFCKAAQGQDLDMCSYGYNYCKINDRMIVGGLIVRDYKSNCKIRNKLISKERDCTISSAMLDKSVRAIQSEFNAVKQVIKNEKNKLIAEYVKNEQYKVDFLTPLKDEIQKGLCFVHDYKQINTQISQNINVVIEQRYVGETFEEKLKKSMREERAIYEASKFLDEKLNVAKFLMHPEWLESRSDCVRSRFHGIVIKYRRIYSPRFENKGINVSFVGKSISEVIAHPQALSVIPHTFMDNASKYSPRNGRVEIYLQDIEEAVEFNVSSFGPLILPKERDQIFQPFFRGEHARKVEEEGAGYGLYLSQLIAQKHLGTKIYVSQEEKPTANLGYWTTFSVKVPLRAAILPDEE